MLLHVSGWYEEKMDETNYLYKVSDSVWGFLPLFGQILGAYPCEFEQPHSYFHVVANHTAMSSLDEKFGQIIFPFHSTSISLLRAKMRETCAILSGSAVLVMLHPNPFQPNDLDFYILPHGFPSFLLFMEDHGYKINGNLLSDGFYDQQCLRLIVTKLVHQASHKIINVITTTHWHVIYCIVSFHSTLVMNYIAWYGIVSLYPQWTMNKAGLIVRNTPITRLCFKKYLDCRFLMRQDINDLAHLTNNHVCCKHPWCPLTKRSLHDGCFCESFEDWTWLTLSPSLPGFFLLTVLYIFDVHFCICYKN